VCNMCMHRQLGRIIRGGRRFNNLVSLMVYRQGKNLDE
jgi:hypothetical protein